MSESSSLVDPVLFGIVLSIGIVVIVTVLIKRSPKKVFLEYLPGPPCEIKIDQPTVEIRTARHSASPTRVTWRVVKSQEKKYVWKFVGKAGDAPLGEIKDIDCDGKETTSNKTNVPVEWEYQIEVYNCDGQDPPLCVLDPKVRVLD